MKKTIWVSFAVAILLVNIIAEVGFFYTGIYIEIMLRVALIFGLTMGAIVFTSSINLIENIEKEKPLSGNVRDTLGADRRQD